MLMVLTKWELLQLLESGTGGYYTAVEHEYIQFNDNTGKAHYFTFVNGLLVAYSTS